jgi:hypothetical protein
MMYEKGQIDWRCVPAEHMTVTEINQLLDDLDKKGIQHITPQLGKDITSIAALSNHWYSRISNNVFYLRYIEAHTDYEECDYKIRSISTNAADPEAPVTITGY